MSTTTEAAPLVHQLPVFYNHTYLCWGYIHDKLVVFYYDTIEDIEPLLAEYLRKHHPDQIAEINTPLEYKQGAVYDVTLKNSQSGKTDSTALLIPLLPDSYMRK